MMIVIGRVSINADGTDNLFNPLVPWQSDQMHPVRLHTVLGDNYPYSPLTVGDH